MSDLIAYIDGASQGNPGPASYAVVFCRDGVVVKKAGAAIGEATNNVAEYFGLIFALLEAKKLGVSRLTVCSDSQLLVRQVNGEYKVKDPWLRRLHGIACSLRGLFAGVTLEHIPRERNKEADRLAETFLKSESSGLF